MKNNNIAANIITDCLCYSLNMTYSAYIAVLPVDTEDVEGYLNQLYTLVEAVKETVVDAEVQKLCRYNAEIISNVEALYALKSVERVAFSTEAILSALCYSLQRAYSSRINILGVDTDDDYNYFMQLKVLYGTINACITDWGIDDVMIEDINWYNASLMTLIADSKRSEDITL